MYASCFSDFLLEHHQLVVICRFEFRHLLDIWSQIWISCRTRGVFLFYRRAAPLAPTSSESVFHRRLRWRRLWRQTDVPSRAAGHRGLFLPRERKALLCLVPCSPRSLHFLLTMRYRRGQLRGSPTWYNIHTYTHTHSGVLSVLQTVCLLVDPAVTVTRCNGQPVVCDSMGLFTSPSTPSIHTLTHTHIDTQCLQWCVWTELLIETYFFFHPKE